ncbi:hypothetical protein ACNHUS_34720 [Actinomycetes bacterium M1A6_2h]
MSPQEGIGGRHRRPKERAIVLTAVPVALALMWGTATAQAAPQDFVTAPDTAQSGTTDATPPASTQQRQFVPGYQPSPRVQQTEWRSYDDYRSGNQQSSYYNPAPAPQPAPTAAPPALQAAPTTPPPPPTVQRKVIAPIDAPDGYILVGGELVPYDPNILDRNAVEQFNNTGAAIQADGGNWLVDNGFADAPRADRIAAGTATGVVAGGLTGLAVSAVPAAIITGTAAAIGGGLGVVATTGTGAIVWGGPVGWVFIPGAGALAGAAAGAALSAPIVLGLTVSAAVLGGLFGATVLGGEQQIIEEPAPLLAPESVPAPSTAPAAAAPLASDAPDIGKTVEKAVTDAPVWTEPAYEQVQRYTSTVLTQPAVADTVAAVTTAAAPLLDQARTALAGLNLPI